MHLVPTVCRCAPCSRPDLIGSCIIAEDSIVDVVMAFGTAAVAVPAAAASISCMMFCKMGSTYANVFPEPVSD